MQLAINIGVELEVANWGVAQVLRPNTQPIIRLTTTQAYKLQYMLKITQRIFLWSELTTYSFWISIHIILTSNKSSEIFFFERFVHFLHFGPRLFGRSGGN